MSLEGYDTNFGIHHDKLFKVYNKNFPKAVKLSMAKRNSCKKWFKTAFFHFSNIREW